jgi:MarR family transcriptional regulator, organic hydroperoxide resistance regulator
MTPTPGPRTGGTTSDPPTGSSGRTSEATEAGDKIDPSLAFLRLLWKLDHGLRSRSKRMEQELGVTGPQRYTLRMLGTAGAQSAGDLANLLELHPSTLTGILERLGRAGFITRTADPKDGRRAVITLTDEGRRLDRRQAGTVEAEVREAVSVAAPDEVAAARRLLARIAALLDA